MAGDDVRYEFKSVQSIRGLETRSKAKWEKDGWEFVEEAEASLFRTKLTFRRPKKQVPRWAWIVGAAVVTAAVIGIIVGAVTEGSGTPDASMTSQAAAAPSSTPIPEATVTSTPAPPAKETVSDAEVLSAFNSYFAERAAAGVMVAKAVTSVTYSSRVVRVTFDPAAAGVSQESFDQLNSFDNLADFAATAIAFNDDVGNRVRPAVDSIQTLSPDGSSLGTLSAVEILAINGLSK